MSQPKPKFTEIDFASVLQDRRAPTPITNLPVNALTDDTDPTKEIRALIEQLQQTNRDSRTQLRNAEDERNELATQLELARRQNDELRAHFVEITSLIRERDSALQEVERHTRMASEQQARAVAAEQACQDLRRQCEATGRQRDELARQKDDLNRRIDAVSQASQETNRSYNEAQRQMLSIRQARDGAMAQNAELTQKLKRSEDAVADLEYNVELLERKINEGKEIASQLEAMRAERDTATQNLEASASELAQARASLAELTTQADAASKAGVAHEMALAEIRYQVTTVTGERDALRAELDGKAAEIAGVQEALQSMTQERNAIAETEVSHQAALAEVQGQIAAMDADRDALRADIAAKAAEIEELRIKATGADQTAALDALKNEINTLQHECSTADLRVQVLSREVIDLRNQLKDRADQVTSLQRAADHTSSNMALTQAQFETLTRERDAAQRLREEAVTSLASAQKQIDKIIRDRDLARQQSAENAIALEAQVEALRAQLQIVELASAGGTVSGHAEISEMARLIEARDMEKRDLSDRLDQQRAETIDLAAQLHQAQEQIKQLGASLAEARLQAKLGGRAVAAAPASREPVLPEVTPTVVVPESAFDPVVSQELLRSMRRCYQAFLKTSSDVSHLNELHCHAHSFSENARTGGFIALHRLSASFSGLAQELYHYPEQVNPSVLRTIGQTIEFLATLLKVKDLQLVKDPASANIYAVDDDADNCDCIRMAMETAMMQTTSSQDPAKAICELAETPCDLIFLDVNLPGMDGFELCAEIRRLTLHATTPIIFLSGLTSSENRMQSSLSGGNEFVGKPFILCELTVKALTLILKAELHLA